MYDRLVIPVDGSEQAARAATRGLELARAFDATVDVVHVVEQKSLRLARTADEKARLRSRGEAILEEIESIASDDDPPVTTTLLEGKPSVRIAEFAADRDADVIVIGRQGLSGLGKRLLGGVTDHVLVRSDVPVFVIPDETDAEAGAGDYSRLLVPTDGSQNAESAAPHAAVIAERYGSEIHVLNVVDLQAAGGAFDAGGLEKEFVERLEASGAEAVEAVSDKLAESAPDVSITTAVERATPPEGITAGIRSYVADNDVDAIVLSSHGRSNVGRQLLGSVASTLVRTADVPVLVVKRSAA